MVQPLLGKQSKNVFEAGDTVFKDFDEAALRMLVESRAKLPPAEELAAMLRDILGQEAKEKILVYLSEIAMADGIVAPEERAMLERVKAALGM